MSDVDKLARATKNSFDQVDKRFDQVDKRFNKLERQIKASEKRIINEFKVVDENIHRDVAGANKDEISLLKDHSKDHEKRITRVEHKDGV